MSNALDNYIWYEKHRPRTIDQLVLEPHTQELIHRYIQDQDIPHLLFYGRAGSGKTTLSQILCASIPSSTITLNASGQDRSIETMRTTVAQFARSMPAKNIKLKIVFFDEADGITPQAQDALKNTIETNSGTCRFILTANNVNKIIEPVRSRCTEIPLLQFGRDAAVAMCGRILQAEGVAHTQKDVEVIVDRYYPDIRSTVNALQRASAGGKLDPKCLGVSDASVDAILGYVRAGAVKSLRTYVVNVTDFMSLYTGMFDRLETLFPGDAAADAAKCLCDHLFYETTIPDREINFTTLCMEWMIMLGVKIDFKK